MTANGFGKARCQPEIRACSRDHKIWRRINYALGLHDGQGVGFTRRINWSMDPALYWEIFGDEFLQMLEYYGFEKDQIVFQQDNDPKQRCALAKRWFVDNRID